MWDSVRKDGEESEKINTKYQLLLNEFSKKESDFEDMEVQLKNQEFKFKLLMVEFKKKESDYDEIQDKLKTKESDYDQILSELKELISKLEDEALLKKDVETAEQKNRQFEETLIEIREEKTILEKENRLVGISLEFKNLLSVIKPLLPSILYNCFIIPE